MEGGGRRIDQNTRLSQVHGPIDDVEEEEGEGEEGASVEVHPLGS